MQCKTWKYKRTKLICLPMLDHVISSAVLCSCSMLQKRGVPAQMHQPTRSTPRATRMYTAPRPSP